MMHVLCIFELSESLNVLSDIHFHLKNCINIQFHCYYHLKYSFVYKYMEKITMENLDRIWTEFGQNLDLILERIKEKIFSLGKNSKLIKSWIYFPIFSLRNRN